ncbi:MAG: BLUF domain-containing protein [Pseudomonadota bacterium]
MDETISISYVSRSLIGDAPDEVSQIAETAAAVNAEKGVTGVLYFNDMIFFQVLEGAESTVTELIDKIRGDSRHADLKTVAEYFCASRTFPNWGMKMVPPILIAGSRRLFEYERLSKCTEAEIFRRIHDLVRAC